VQALVTARPRAMQTGLSVSARLTHQTGLATGLRRKANVGRDQASSGKNHGVHPRRAAPGLRLSVTPHRSVGGFRPPAGTALARGLEPRLTSVGRGIVSVAWAFQSARPYRRDIAAHTPMRVWSVHRVAPRTGSSLTKGPVLCPTSAPGRSALAPLPRSSLQVDGVEAKAGFYIH
jgi:hypothetical protein